MTRRVTVDPDLCSGFRECVRIAPDAFRIDEARGISQPTDAAETADSAEIDEAIDACPMRAISAERAS